MIELTFEKDKETSGTNRFKEITEPGVRGTVGSIYVLKEDLTKIGNPTRIKVTIDKADG